jgi:hypothetical protein
MAISVDVLESSQNYAAFFTPDEGVHGGIPSC